MNALQLAQTRYTCKAYRPDHKLCDTVRQRLLDSLVLTPSSVNIQPWRFFVARDDNAKRTIAQAMMGHHAHNIPKVLGADTVVVMACRHIDDSHITAVMDCEEQAGRFADSQAKIARTQFCLEHINALDKEQKQVWLHHQIYLALGQLLTLAQLEGVNATPIEGFDKVALDTILDLPKQACHSVVIVALGVASESDFNAQLPKARLASTQVLHYL